MPTFDDYTTQHGAELSAALTAFEQQETPKGFINSHENGMALIKHLADNNMPATLASLELSARMHVEKGYKFYLTPQELSLQNMRNNFPAAQLAAFDAWWGRQKHLVHSPQAETAILAQCQGRVFSNEVFDQAAGRASHNGLVEEQRSVHYQQGQYSGRTDLRDESPLEERLDVFGKPIAKTTSYRGSIREEYENALRARAERDRPSAVTEAHWKAKMEDLQTQANTHSQRAQLRAILVTDKNGRVDYPATCAELERAIAAQGSR
jgi:hypothetical protein